MKIIQVTPFFYPVIGGVETHVFEISKRLSKKHEVTVFTSDVDREGKRLPTYQKIGKVLVKRFKTILRLSEFVTYFPGIFNEIKNLDSDVIHVHAFRHPHNFLPLFYRRKYVITLHFPVYPSSSIKRRMLTFLFDNLVGKKLLKKYEKIIALTKGEKIWILKRFKIRKSKVEIIPNGISKHYLKRHNPNLFMNKFGVNKEKFLIISVGRVHKSKGFQDLLKAIHILPNKIKENIVAYIIGPDAGFLGRLKILRRIYGLTDKVFFTGKVSEKVKLSAYEACDLFILPSYWEGFGITLLEAMAKDKPVMARNTGGQKWVVPEKQFLFNSVVDLARKIKLFYEGKLRKSLNYKEIVKEKYVWDKIVDKLIKVYEDAIHNSNSV